MKTINCLFSLLLFAQISFSQIEDRYQINGTHCSMIPPTGFSANVSGFQDITGVSFIVVAEIPVSYDTLANAFTEQALLQQNMILSNRAIIEYNGDEAMWLTVKQSANEITYHKEILLFGNDTISILVTGMHPSFENDLNTAIKNAMLTTIFDPAQTDNSIESANFSVNVEVTEFIYARSMGGFLSWSKEGKVPTEAVDAAHLTAGSSFRIDLGDKKEFSIQRIKAFPNGDKTDIKTI